MNEQGSERRDDQPPAAGRKTYEPPRIASEDIFETTALMCLKKPGQGGSCVAGNRKNS